MYLKTRGLVVRVSEYNDQDYLLTLLTPEHGRLTVRTRGARRKTSPLVVSFQLLSLAEYTLFEYKGKYTINEASSITFFLNLRSDIVKLSLGTYFAQVSEVLSQSDMPNRELFSLVLNCLYALSDMHQPENKVKAVFELRCACLAGYTPDLTGCHICGTEYPEFLDVSAGVLECRNCHSPYSNGLRLPVSTGMLDAMRYIVMSDEKRILGFQVSPATLEKLSQITETYLITQLERGFSTLDFYKSLLLPPPAP